MATPLHKPPTSAGKLTRLLMAITLAIIAVLPAAAQSTSKPQPVVNMPSITVPIWGYVTLEKLISGGAVSGIDVHQWQDFTPSVTTEGKYEIDDFQYRPHDETPATLTYTYKKDSQLTFSLEVVAKTSIVGHISKNLPPIYKNHTQTLNLPDDCLPLSEFSLEKDLPEGFTGDFSYIINGDKSISFTGLAEGAAILRFHHKYAEQFIWIDVVPAPNINEIEITEEPIVVPGDTWVYLSKLVSAGVITGDPGRDDDYEVTASNDKIVQTSNDGSFRPYANGSSTITFTHKHLPEVTFSIPIIVKTGAHQHILRTLGTLFVDEAKTVDCSDESIVPLNEYVVTRDDFEDCTGDVEWSIDANSMTIKGLTKGSVRFDFTHKYGYSGLLLNVVEKPSSGDVTVKNGIVLSTGARFNLQNLIRGGIVAGIDENTWGDYAVSTSDPEIISVDDSNRDWPYLDVRWNTGKCTLTFTHKELGDDMKFSLPVEVKNGADRYINENRGTIYAGEPKTYTIPTDYIPLSDYESIEVGVYNDEPDPEMTVAVDAANNTLTLTAKKEGMCYLQFTDKNKITSGVRSLRVVKKPSAADVTVKNGVILPAGHSLLNLWDFIRGGIVSGIDENTWRDYALSTSDSDIISVTDSDSDRPSFNVGWNLGTCTLTFTHKEFGDDMKFSLTVEVKMGADRYINANRGTIYVGEPKPYIIPADYIPLSDYESIEVGVYDDQPDPEMTVTVDTANNTLTVTAQKEGECYIRFTDKNQIEGIAWNLCVTKKPSAADVTVIEPSIEVPTGGWIYLSRLVENKVVEGITVANGSDWLIESSDTENVQCDTDGSLTFRAPATATITFTNREFPDVKFDIEMTAKNGAHIYVASNLGTVYLGEWKTLTIPDGYIPLSAYSSIELYKYNEYPDTEAELRIEGNTISIKGVTEGKCYMAFDHKYCYTTSEVSVAKKPSAGDVVVPKEHVVLPSVFRTSLENLIKAGIVTGIDAGDAQNYELTSSDRSVISASTNITAGRSAAGKSATVTFKHKEVEGVQFDITFDVVESCYPSLSYSVFTWASPAVMDLGGEIPGEDYTLSYDNYYNQFATCDLTGGKLTVTGKKAGQCYFQIYYKEYAHVSGWFTVSEDRIRVNETVEVPIGSSVNLSRLGVEIIQGIPASGVSDYVMTSSDSSVVSSRSNYVAAIGLGRATVTYTHKACPDVSFTVDMKVGNNPVNLIPTTLYIDQPKTITFDESYVSLDKFTIRFNSNETGEQPEIKIEGNTLTLTGKEEMEGTLVFIPKATGVNHSRWISVVPVPVDTPEVIDGEGIAQTDAEVPVKIELPEEVKQEQEKLGADVEFEWVADNEEIATVDENGVVIPNKLGCTTITYRVKQTSTSQKPAFRSRSGKDGVLMTLEFWVTKVVIEGPEKLKAGVPAQISFRVDAGDDEYPYDVKDIEWNVYYGADLISGQGSQTITITPADGKTYANVELTTSIGTAFKSFPIVADDDDPITTGIGDVEAEEGFQPVYDLNGRLVARTPEQKASLASGIYIQGGKKIYLRR